MLLLLTLAGLGGCAQALAIDPALRGPAGTTGARATGIYPDFRDEQRRATPQLTAARSDQLRRELARERAINESIPAGGGPAPGAVQAAAARAEQRRLQRIRASGATD